MMLHKTLLSLLLLGMLPMLLMAQDTSKYVRKYAYLEKDPTLEYEKGQVFYLVDGIYKVWTGSDFNWGFYDENTKEQLTEPKYDTITYRYVHKNKQGFYRIKENGKWGLLGDDRSVWVATQYDRLNYVSKRQEPYISIEQNGKYGVLNTKGEVLLEAVYEDILFDGFRYQVKKSGSWGLKDSKGKELIPICFDAILDHPYLAKTRLKKDNKWVVFNWVKDQPCTIEKGYDAIDFFHDYFIVRDQTKFGLLDLNGKEVLPFDYSYMAPFFMKQLKTLLVGQNQQVGVLRIDSLHKSVVEVPIEYSDVWVEERTFKIKVRKGDKIDYFFGQSTLFDLIYNNVQYYEAINRVMVKQKGKWGMSTVEGEIEIPIAYDKIHFIDGQHYMVQKGKLWGVVNSRGREIIPINYDEFDFRSEQQFFFAKRKGKWGLVSLKKGVILPPEFEDIRMLPNRTYLVLKSGKWGVVAAGGREIEPFEFSYFKYLQKKRDLRLYRPDGTFKKHRLL